MSKLKNKRFQILEYYSVEPIYHNKGIRDHNYDECLLHDNLTSKQIILSLWEEGFDVCVTNKNFNEISINEDIKIPLEEYVEVEDGILIRRIK